MADSPSRIVVIDDDEDLRFIVYSALTKAGFTVLTLDENSDYVSALDEIGADLVVLDVNMGKVSGLNVLEDLRSRSSLPVILLTSLSDEADRVRGLDLGADDYVVKPFMPNELASRVRSVLRRVNGTVVSSGYAKFTYGRMNIDEQSRSITVAGSLVSLTKLEFDLLLTLAASPGEVFSRDRLLEQVWHSEREWQDPETVTEHIRRLRLKIDARHIVTIRGVGYKFEP